MQTSVLTGLLLVAVDVLVHGDFHVLARLEYVIVFNTSKGVEFTVIVCLTFGFNKFGYAHTVRYSK